MPALRRKGTGNPECRRFRRCDQTASPKGDKEEHIGEGARRFLLPITLVPQLMGTLPGGHPAQFGSSLPILA